MNSPAPTKQQHTSKAGPSASTDPKAIPPLEELIKELCRLTSEAKRRAHAGQEIAALSSLNGMPAVHRLVVELLSAGSEGKSGDQAAANTLIGQYL